MTVKPKMSAKNAAEATLSVAGTIVWSKRIVMVHLQVVWCTLGADALSISSILSLCTNRKSKHCASAFGACRQAGLSWLCETIREAGHGDEHRGAKVTMPMG